MKLQTLDLAALYFPRQEWRWLRASVRLPSPEQAPDQFLWAASVEDKLWAWHPRGSDIDVTVPGPTPQKINVLVLETDGSELAAHGLYLKTIFTAAPAHDVEWAVALQVLTSRLHYQAADRGLPAYWKEALEACGLEPHLGILAQRGRYTFLNEAEQRHLAEKRWDLATFEMLESMALPVRAAFLAAIRKWNLSAQQAREALNFTLILAKKISEKTALNVLGNAFKSAEEFRMALFRTAQPELATLSQKRIEMLRDLKAPPRSSVYGDPSFESDLLKITHTPRRISDFESFKYWIGDPETTEKLRQLLEIYQ
ncbi:MAG: hypothetical protein HY074_19800 [Deltaproteobacteria bacterium]|nr:hypothetical protein [Deltaproteobacteria bacterium]